MNHSHRPNRAVRWLAAGTAALGLGIGAAGLASAASGDTGSASTDTVVAADSSTASDGATTPPADAAPVDPASLPHGPGETVLTGTEAEQVTAAALAAEPGATVIRVETDSSGHTYEAHVTTADGTQKTLYFDENFQADGSDEGFGPGPQGDHGAPPADASTADATATNG